MLLEVKRLNGKFEKAKIAKVIRSWSRWTGTGYKSEEVIFKSENGESFYGQIDHNRYDQFSGNFYDVGFEIEDPRPARREFWQKTIRLAEKLKVSHEVARALHGNEEIIRAVKEAALKYNKPNSFPKGIEWELTATGISRRKGAIKFVLGEELYAQALIEDMGQMYSEILAQWVAELITPPQPEVASADDEMWF